MPPITRLEHFPNELLVTILSYLDAREIYRSITGLNARFNAILRSLNHFSETIDTPDNIEESYRDYPHVWFFSSAIVKLNLQGHTSCDLSSFSNLRSLTLGCYVPRECLTPDIFSSLRKLELEKESDLYPSGDFRFSAVTRVAQRSLPTINASALRWLRLELFNPTDYDRLLFGCPALRYLDIDFAGSFHLSIRQNQGICQHANLKHLKLMIRNRFDINQFDAILERTPGLENFDFMGDHSFPPVRLDLHRLAEILAQRLCQLRKLKWFLFVRNAMPGEHEMDLETVQRLHPCFNHFRYTHNPRSTSYRISST